MTAKSIQVEPEESLAPPIQTSPAGLSKPLTVADSLDNLLGMIIRNLIASSALIALPNLLFPLRKRALFYHRRRISHARVLWRQNDRTPAIDALAADGTLFLNAFATTASCSASRSVVMSGLHNHANGQYGHQHAFHKFASYYNAIGLSLPRHVECGLPDRTHWKIPRRA